MNKFGKEALDVHNKYRVLHQVPELKWSRKLEKDAETWANQLAKEGRLKHDDTDDGENVYAVMGKDDVTGAEVVDRWYSEVEKYDFNNPGFKSGIGHFTQVVWKETKELGIAKAKSDDGKIFVVARYHPAGNYMNQFQDNVKPKATEQNGDVANPAETKKITIDSEKRDCKATSSPKEEFPKQSLDAHNKFRSMHGVPPLSWADDLAKDAQAWAEKLANARTLQHASKSERNDAGENIAMFTGSFDTAGEKATDMWYGEYKDYDFSRGGWQKGTGHFTQVVWKSTKELGIGRAKTADGKLTFVVGRYRPAGNILNYMADNVFDLSHKA
ncbi:unnamed protein product [Porites evermanni]|uniref:SCP domain-containing protein n=1 Tax=Porites evermanni TaxID=104178 RepID=A0ABN8QXH8_9CNID|nr:unnamed protein product [Porites evermanni]